MWLSLPLSYHRPGQRRNPRVMSTDKNAQNLAEAFSSALARRDRAECIRMVDAALQQGQLVSLKHTRKYSHPASIRLPEFTAFENVLMPHYIKSRRIDKALETRAHELMDMVGLSRVKDNLAGSMSGGQQQRTAIARSLINSPKIILADEPTGNLDSEASEVVYELLRGINRELGTTFVVITHDRRIAEKTDRIIETKDGRIYSDFNRR